MEHREAREPGRVPRPLRDDTGIYLWRAPLIRADTHPGLESRTHRLSQGCVWMLEDRRKQEWEKA